MLRARLGERIMNTGPLVARATNSVPSPIFQTSLAQGVHLRLSSAPLVCMATDASLRESFLAVLVEPCSGEVSGVH